MARTRAKIALGIALVAGCRHHDRTSDDAVVIAETKTPIKIDGELSEPDWNEVGAPRVFTANGGEARPYSQVRLLHDATTLYVGLYAADQDVRSTDKFEVAIGPLQLAVTAAGIVSPAVPGVRAGKDLDGTIDHPDDEDEEWVIELAIPLAAAGLANPDIAVPFRASRCDTPKDGVVRCGEWAANVRW